MRDHDVGAIPVCEGGKPIGMVTDRDVAIRAFANGKEHLETHGKRRDEQEGHLLP